MGYISESPENKEIWFEILSVGGANKKSRYLAQSWSEEIPAIFLGFKMV
jgi:hypothetical protein